MRKAKNILQKKTLLPLVKGAVAGEAMPCFSPLSGYRSRHINKNGKREIVFNQNKGLVDLSLKVPCGKCIGCKIAYAQGWQTRLHNEAKMHPDNCFVTTTYNPENCPPLMSLDKKHLQNFHKKIRNHYGSFRFYACGEYGELNKRPHYHAALFGIGLSSFDDLKRYKKTPQGFWLYTSETLTELWGKGFVVIAAFTAETAGYICQYVTKKITGPKSELNYMRFDSTTGETWQVETEFAIMSRRPGLGSTWYDKFKTDAFPDDFLVRNGKRIPVPNYYRRKLEKENNAMYSELKLTRKIRAKKSSDNTADRLYTREECTLARLKAKKRTL